jgi:hypothetical protein
LMAPRTKSGMFGMLATSDTMTSSRTSRAAIREPLIPEFDDGPRHVGRVLSDKRHFSSR